MKHARALAAEPPLLGQYRAMYPNEERRPATEAAATWEGFKTDQAAYKQLLDGLARAQQGLCLYCEQLLIDTHGKLIANDYQVEHVHPKSGAVGRVLDWTNLALACCGGTYPHHRDATRFSPGSNQSCGQAKEDASLPPGSDPRSLPLERALIDVGMDGTLEATAANCAAVGAPDADITTAIRLLNLNCERLRKARQDRRDNINGWFVPLLAELRDAPRCGGPPTDVGPLHRGSAPAGREWLRARILDHRTLCAWTGCRDLDFE